MCVWLAGETCGWREQWDGQRRQTDAGRCSRLLARQSRQPIRMTRPGSFGCAHSLGERARRRAGAVVWSSPSEAAFSGHPAIGAGFGHYGPVGRGLAGGVHSHSAHQRRREADGERGTGVVGWLEGWLRCLTRESGQLLRKTSETDARLGRAAALRVRLLLRPPLLVHDRTKSPAAPATLQHPLLPLPQTIARPERSRRKSLSPTTPLRTPVTPGSSSWAREHH